MTGGLGLSPGFLVRVVLPLFGVVELELELDLELKVPTLQCTET